MNGLLGVDGVEAEPGLVPETCQKCYSRAHQNEGLNHIGPDDGFDPSGGSVEHGDDGQYDDGKVDGEAGHHFNSDGGNEEPRAVGAESP